MQSSVFYICTEPSRGFTEHKDQGCSGTSVEEYSTRSARHCSWQCNLRTDCQAYVFHRRQRKCTLKIECQVETLVPAVEETTYITTGNNNNNRNNWFVQN